MARRNPPVDPHEHELVIWFHHEPEPHFHIKLGAAEGVMTPEVAWQVCNQVIATLVEFGALPE